MELNQERYQQLKALSIPNGMHHSDELYVQDGKIYKIFNSTDYIDEKKRNIEFLIQNPIAHTPVIYEPLYIQNHVAGYIMDYIPNVCTFREALTKNLSLEQKIHAIQDVFQALGELHEKNIFIGDIHSDNFMIDLEGNGYIVDLEEIRFLGDEFKFKQCYLVKPNEHSYKINVASRYTDNVKLMISSLSLLLNVDLEKYIMPSEHCICLEQIYKEVVLPLNQPVLNEYFLALMNKEDVPYFSDCLDSLQISMDKGRIN